MTNVRERVARAIHGVGGTDAINDNWSLRSPLNVYDGERAHQWRIDQADAAIAAMGLPTRVAMLAALDAVFLLKLNWLGARLEHGDSGPNTDPAFEKYIAARQRLLDLIPMKEDGDE